MKNIFFIQRHATVGRTPLDEWLAHRRDFYLTTHNTQTFMSSVGFELTVAVGERPQTNALDRAATGAGWLLYKGKWGYGDRNNKKVSSWTTNTYALSWVFVLPWRNSTSGPRPPHYQEFIIKLHSRQDSPGRVISATQKPLPDNTQHSQQKDIHATGGIQTRSPCKRATAHPRLRPCGHWYRLTLSLRSVIYGVASQLCF
jgi:hypothetical protein